MAHLIDEYAKSLGVKISRPVIKDHFFPLVFDKYITINQANKIPSKTYAHYDIVLSLLHPYLQEAGIKVLQLGGKSKIDGVDSALNVSLKQQNYLLSNSMLHIGCDSIVSQLASLKSIPTITLFGNTFPSSTKPIFSSSSLNTLLSPTWDKKPCFSSEDPKKQINSIKPEIIAQKVVDVLKLGKEKIDFRTKHVGTSFSAPVIEVVPTSFSHLRIGSNQTIVLRCDYGCDEQALIRYCSAYKSVIVSDRLIQPQGIQHFGANISNLYVFVDKDWETIPQSYIDLLKRMNISLTLLVKNEDDLGAVRNKYFDLNVSPYKQEREKPCELSEKAGFMSALRIIENGKEYLSHAHWKKGLDTNNKVLDTPDYWKELDYFYIYDRD